MQAPDPALLFALARHYDVEDLGDLIGLLVKERLGRLRQGRRVFVSFGTKYSREQRRIAEWFAEFSPELQHVVLIGMEKFHAAEFPPRPFEPVRRRDRL